MAGTSTQNPCGSLYFIMQSGPDLSKCLYRAGPDTWICVVGRLTYRTRNIISTQEADVTSTSWLRSLPPSTEPCTITPLDMLSMKRETRVNFARKYDVFGDSYAEEIDEDTLKRCFQKMDDNVSFLKH